MTGTAEARGIKRALARSLRAKLAKEGISISQFAQQIGTGRTAARRILDEKNVSITLQTMDRAARVLGYRLVLTARPMTPREIGTVARAMVNANTPAAARHFKARLMSGFYGDAQSPAQERPPATARSSTR